MKVNQKRKADLTRSCLLIVGTFGLIIILICTVPIISDRFGPEEALAVEDNTKEIMALSITDAQELWSTARDRKENRTADGDKIAIAIIASKLFEMRYLQTYIK